MENPYNPPVKTQALPLPADLGRSELFDLIQSQWDLGPEALASALKHGGVYLDKKRLSAWPAHFKKGSLLAIYRFLREPAPLPLSAKDILYEDAQVLAVNKPAWLPTQGTRVSSLYSLEEELKTLTGNKNVMAAHRLDRQTSGVVLFGKTSPATAALMKQFTDKQIDKKYYAVVSPPPSEKEWEVTGYLLRDFRKLPLDCFRLIEKEKKGAKWSQSRFLTLQTEGDRALIECEPVTGRTHQLRIHLAKSGSPILGDTVYGSFKEAKKFGDCRIQLHSYKIVFPDRSGKPVTVIAPSPEDFLWVPPSPSSADTSSR